MLSGKQTVAVYGEISLSSRKLIISSMFQSMLNTELSRSIDLMLLSKNRQIGLHMIFCFSIPVSILELTRGLWIGNDKVALCPTGNGEDPVSKRQYNTCVSVLIVPKFSNIKCCLDTRTLPQ